MATFNDKLSKYFRDAILKSAGIPPFASGGTVSASPLNGSSVTTGITSSGMAGFSESGAPREWDLAVGEIYGYRWWQIKVPAELAGFTGYGEDFRFTENPLTGANNQRWKPGRNEAVCTNAYSKLPTWSDLLAGTDPCEHEPPEIRTACGCGFWAYFDKDLNVDSVISGLTGDNPQRSGTTVRLPVFGVIRGTGRVIIGTKGFRSQYAEIVGLCVSDRAKSQLRWWLVPALEETWFGSSGAAVIRQASDSERLGRIAAIEAVLSVSYPGARIFCDQEALAKYFPPDKNYGITGPS